MRWNLFELQEENDINLDIDYKDKLKSNLNILDINNTNISGKIYKYESKLEVSLIVKTDLVLACARTLKPVDYQLEFALELEFSSTKESDYPLENTLDLYDIVFGNIISELPYRVFHPDSKEDDF